MSHGNLDYWERPTFFLVWPHERAILFIGDGTDDYKSKMSFQDIDRVAELKNAQSR